MSETAASILAWPFVWRAFAVVLVISLCAALLGVTLVLRRLSFMGDGLSHVAFGSVAISGAIGLGGGGMGVALAATTVAAVFLLRSSKRGRGDASLAIASVTAMACGYLLMNAFPATANISGDVCTTLFGASSLLTLTKTETWMCIALSAAVIIFQLFTFHRSFDIAFDEDFARASGVNAARFNFASAIISAVVIVVSMRLVGALLVSALLVFPAVAAMRLAKSFRSVTLIAALFAIVSASIGLGMAILCATPVGATIVAVDALALFASRSAKMLCALFAALALAIVAMLFLPREMQGERHAGYFKTKPSIIATIAPVYDWTREVLGEHTNDVALALLLKGGADIHGFDPTAENIEDIIQADALICVGGVSDSWVDRVLRTHAGSSCRKVALMNALMPRAIACSCACEEHHDHEHHEHHDHEHEHHDHEHHEDEHIWLSLRDAAVCVSNIAELAGALDPANAADYRANAKAYSARLADLDSRFTSVARRLPQPLVFADRFPFARFADDYGLDCEAAFHGCAADAEASFATLSHLAHEVAEHNVAAIFILEGSSKDLANAVCEAAGRPDAAIATLDSLETPSSHSYLERMERNLGTLQTQAAQKENNE